MRLIQFGSMKTRHYLTEDDLRTIRYLIEVDQLQQWKVAERIGVHVGTIEKVCKRLQLATQRSGPKSGAEHPDWTGGRVKVKGYWYVYSPGHPFARKGVPYVLEHRLVMEAKLRRYLLPGEVVHHIDANRENNIPENLIVFGSNAKHLKHELTGRVPKWTPQGLDSLKSAADRRKKYSGTKSERAKQAQQRYDKFHRRNKSGARRSPQSSDRPPS